MERSVSSITNLGRRARRPARTASVTRPNTGVPAGTTTVPPAEIAAESLTSTRAPVLCVPDPIASTVRTIRRVPAGSMNPPPPISVTTGSAGGSTGGGGGGGGGGGAATAGGAAAAAAVTGSDAGWVVWNSTRKFSGTSICCPRLKSANAPPTAAPAAASPAAAPTRAPAPTLATVPLGPPSAPASLVTMG